jgi:GrpB-like predicted nucleotidyltransferase (UPF0157 family)
MMDAIGERVAFGREDTFREAAQGAFAAEHRALLALLPRAVIEHVGSTAVAGSFTKGDLDLCVVVEPADFPASDSLLGGRYARNLESIHTAEFAAFTAEGHAVPVGIQLVARGSEWDTFVRWRDLLRGDAGLRQRYDLLKQRFEQKPMDDYRAARAAFIQESLSVR